MRLDPGTLMIACGLLAAGLVVTCPANGAGADDADALRRRIARLEQRLEALAPRPADRWLTERRAEEIRGLVRDVVADADTRASLLGGGLTAGYEKGFFIAGADGGFRLDIKGQVQVRWISGHQDDGPADDDRRGFEVTRTRVGLAGHVIDPSWRYFVWGGWTGSGASILLDAWIEKRFENGWSVRTGQFKLPAWREWTVSETRQQFVERSILDARYAQGYSKGILASRAGDDFRLHLAFSDGLRTINTPWSIGPDRVTGTLPYQQSTEYALTARGEWKLAGAWSQYADFTSFPGEDPMCVVGASIHYQDGEYGTDDDEIEIFQWTVDGSFEFGGANLYGAVIGTSVEDESVDRDEIGFLVQGGLFVADDWEVIARFEYGDMDGGGDLDDTLSVLTVGVNRFFAKHALKWTTDGGYAFDPIDAAWAAAGRGFRPDGPGRDGQVVVRTQMQLLF
jgi:hypothetical protein